MLRISVIVSLLALSSAALAQSVTWELANEYPASSLAGEGDTYFAKLVEERTAGRVRIVPKLDGALGYKSRDQLRAVAEGKVAMADSFAGALGDTDAIFLLSSLPFLTPAIADARRLFDLARPAYERALAKQGQKLLFASPWPPSGIWAKQAMTSVEALRSLKIRTYDATSAEVMGRAGAQARNLSFNEVVGKLEAGEINAVLSSGDGGAGRSLWKYLDHFSEINYAIPLSLVTVSIASWNALDEAARGTVQAAADETMAHQWRQMEGRVEQNYQRMRDNHVTIATDVPPEVRALLAQSSAKAIGDWLEKTGDAGRALLEKFRAAPAK